MRLQRSIRLGIKNLLLHKLRSFLTMLGVVLGVSSVIAMLAVGEGASKEALEAIRKLGSTNIIIRSVKAADEEAQNVRVRMSIYGLLYEDVDRIAGSFSEVRRIVPAKIIRKEGRLGSRSMELRVVGTTSSWFELVRRPVVAGRVLSSEDSRRRRSVVVLTEAGARRLLAAGSSIGQTLRIGGDIFEVIGIVRSEGGLTGDIQTPDQGTDAYIPLEVVRERFGDLLTERTSGTSIRELVELHQVIAEVNTIDDVEATAAGIESLLQRFHPNQDYRISVPLALLRQAEATKRLFNIVLGTIAAISLVVGGVGIMNIMLASVTERTREIGVRRAIGAKRKQIVSQFLIESAVLSTIGGLIGIGVGLLMPRLITAFAGMPTFIEPWALMLPLGISLTVGLVFGIYPAYRAAGIDPIEALRHE